MNTFLFIIPLTPKTHLTPLRQELQQLCFKTLLSQTYSNWRALIIGEKKPEGTGDKRFIHIDKEGFKELKLQWASQYIRENNLTPNYIIRLDDDDLFNPTILEKYKSISCDVVVDLKHWFLDWGSKQCSRQFRPWFANTVIHKTNNALAIFGEISRKGISQVNDNVSLIETNHANMHEYYIGKKVVFEKDSPLYLRVLNEDSITSNSGKSYMDYLKEFGEWDKDLPFDLGEIFCMKKVKTKFVFHRKSLKQILSEFFRIRNFKKLFK